MLRLIKPKRISDQVFDQLKDLIFKGSLKAGEKVMTERELARALGVSRPTIREAIYKLVAMGLLEHRQGQGTFVRPPCGDPSGNLLAALVNGPGVTLPDLLELTTGLECHAAALAAARAGEEDVRGMETTFEEMIEAVKEGGPCHEADAAFHMAIAYATGNTAHVHVMKSLSDLLFHGAGENLQLLFAEHVNLDRVFQQHAAILDAIRRHDPDAAFRTMKEHLAFVSHFFEAGVRR